VRDGDRERAEGQLPVGALVTEAFGDGDRAAQALVDARRPGEQRAVGRVSARQAISPVSFWYASA
jgi:hypothetical protein